MYSNNILTKTSQVADSQQVLQDFIKFNLNHSSTIDSSLVFFSVMAVSGGQSRKEKLNLLEDFLYN